MMIIDNLKAELATYKESEVDTDVELAFVKQAVLDLALIVSDLVKLIK